MPIRTAVLILFSVLLVAMAVCAFAARKSKRAIAYDVQLLIAALAIPVFGNFLIILSSDWLVSNIGCYVYYIGLDVAVVALLRFSANYCNVPYMGTKIRAIVIAVVACDILQLLLNPLTGHAFTTTPAMVDGATYYSLMPLAGQAVHRVVAYGIFFVSVALFFYKTVTASSVYAERFFVILLSMIVVGIWETVYIFSGAPIDLSMIGIGVFGLLVYYFAIRYKPVRLLGKMLTRVVSSLQTGVFFFAVDGACIYANDEARALIGIEGSDELPSDVNDSIRDAIAGWGGSFNEDWHVMRRIAENDRVRFLDIMAIPVSADNGRYIGTSLVVRDATEEEEKLLHEKHLATHDPLTGLYNQRFLFERTRELIDSHPDVNYRVVGIDIKDFKIINDILNKEFGDHVICALADIMRENVIPGSVYGRLTGDRFGFAAPADSFSEEQMNQLLDTRAYGDLLSNYHVVVHMGIYDVVDRGVDVSVMYDRAFMAIASIKNDFSRHIATYDAEMRSDLLWSQMISSQLENAIRERQIMPYLQPMVDSEGTIEGAEVLVRWNHPTEGFLSPARFIPVFEKNGMIAQLDKYMWRCACEKLRDWSERGIDLFLSVNISPKDFFFIDVYGTVRELVDEYGIDPSKLRLEITETVMMTDLENRLRIIEKLREDGFMVEMDDFGSGYSSLNMLKDIPVDVLKIDMMFLYKTKDQGKAETILQTIINLSEELGIPSVTEGVETAEQLDMLVRMGCCLFQGYYFAKPMPVDEFEEKYRAA